MDHFVDGRLGRLPADARRSGSSLARAKHLHAVLVEGAIAEIDAAGRPTAPLRTSRYPPTSSAFATTPWSGSPRPCATWTSGSSAGRARRTTRRSRACATSRSTSRRVLVVTMGARAVRIFDGRASAAPPEQRGSPLPGQAVEVAGTTLGCGDAFIAWFLDELLAHERPRRRGRTRHDGRRHGDGLAAPAPRRRLPEEILMPRSTCTPSRATTRRRSSCPATRSGRPRSRRASTAGWRPRARSTPTAGLVGYTGTVNGVPVSVQVTMMGSPTTGIVVEELLMLGVTTLIRVGTTGRLRRRADRRRDRGDGVGRAGPATRTSSAAARRPRPPPTSMSCSRCATRPRPRA